jgi:hypothetical protein
MLGNFKLMILPTKMAWIDDSQFCIRCFSGILETLNTQDYSFNILREASGLKAGPLNRPKTPFVSYLLLHTQAIVFPGLLTNALFVYTPTTTPTLDSKCLFVATAGRGTVSHTTIAPSVEESGSNKAQLSLEEITKSPPDPIGAG